jgi:hypothetical protein
VEDLGAFEIHFCLLPEKDGTDLTIVKASRYADRVVTIEQVSTTRTLLRNVKFFVPKDRVIRTRLDELLHSLRFDRIYENQAIFSLINGTLAGLDAGSIITMLAHHGEVGYLNMGFDTALILVDLNPKLAGLGLWLGIGRPIVTAVLVLAADLAAITANTFFDIYDKYFHSAPPSTHEL